MFGKVYFKHIRKTEKRNTISLGICGDCSGLPTDVTDAPILYKNCCGVCT